MDTSRIIIILIIKHIYNNFTTKIVIYQYQLKKKRKRKDRDIKNNA